MFSIIIPTWNNLEYLKLCVDSIKANSTYDHQIILHVNEGADGSKTWAEQAGVDFTFSDENIGICKAVNLASGLIKKDYVVFMNDDMYCLPGWDALLVDEIKKLDTDLFMLSSTMIEPRDTGNKCVVVANYGSGSSDFKKEQLLHDYKSLMKEDWSGSTWPPSVVHKKWWSKVGGYSEEFSPGMSSDDDFAMKMWAEGCRYYKGLGDSKVYHFISKSTGRIVKNDGRKQFLHKWGVKQSTFHKFYIKRGEAYNGKLFNPSYLNLAYLFSVILSKLRLMW